MISSSVFALRPLADAWRAIDAARVMSSYELLVQTADQRRRDLQRPVVGSAPRRRRSADLVGAVGGVRAVDQRLQLVEVDLDHLVVAARCRRLGRAQVVGDLVGGVGDRLAAGRLQVLRHVVVVGEQRCRWRRSRRPCCRSCALPVAEMRVGAGAEVLDDRAGAALDGQHPGHLEDHVLRRRPSAERAGQPDADHLRPAHVEREAGHHVDGVGAADADRHHAEAAGVRGVAVGADHHPAGEGVVLEHDLVDDAAARAPEADAVLGADRAQEVVDLAVGVDRDAEVDARRRPWPRSGGRSARCWAPPLRQAGGHELQQRHLRRGVLHGDAVGVEVGVARAALDRLVDGSPRWLSRIFSARVSGRPNRSRPAARSAARVVHALDQFDWRSCGDRHGAAPLQWLGS